jgi:hypothetical protein
MEVGSLSKRNRWHVFGEARNDKSKVGMGHFWIDDDVRITALELLTCTRTCTDRTLVYLLTRYERTCLNNRLSRRSRVSRPFDNEEAWRLKLWRNTALKDLLPTGRSYRRLA